MNTEKFFKGIKNAESVKHAESPESSAHQHTRVVVMLGGRMENASQLGEGESDLWHFPIVARKPTNIHALPVEVSGGESRMLAVQSLLQQGSDAYGDAVVLVTGGGEPVRKDGEPIIENDGTKVTVSRAEEAAHQLRERYKVPNEVVSVSGRGSTVGNAAATMKYIHENKERIGTLKEIEIVTNDFHMLRAWIMFSQGLLSLTEGKELKVTDEDKQRIVELLSKGTPAEGAVEKTTIKETRDAVMRILAGYFTDLKIAVVPRVVEDVLETTDGTEDASARARYAGMLRTNTWVQKTIAFEYNGIKDLLDGKYKGS